ncbi:membrane protein insertase YidC [Candidatus Parcubacteria bacterium]|nr:membrane protein insertase YidC [Candidatus Parcubacteria bacterium]
MFQTFFYQPIFNLLIWLYNIVPGHDLGLAIIALTIIIKLVLLPLTKQQIKSQKALQDLQPKIDEIKKKYKDKKEAMGRAMMELYKKNKVNPFSSCLPLLVQLPFLFAVFRIFREGLNGESLSLVYSFISRPETLNTLSFGIVDLAEPRNIYLAVLAALATFWQARMMSTKKPAVKSKGAKDENMMAIMNKQMLYFMPILTFFISYQFPAGLALYWLTTTILTVFQQMYIFKSKEAVADSGQDKSGKVIEGEVVSK